MFNKVMMILSIIFFLVASSTVYLPYIFDINDSNGYIFPGCLILGLFLGTIFGAIALRNVGSPPHDPNIFP